MILSFKQKFPWGTPTNFKEKIFDDIKIHSIREDKKGRWTVGRLIHMAYGVRTKFYNCFRDTEKCISTQSLRISYINFKFPMVHIRIEGDIFFKGVLPVGTDDPGFSRISLLAKNDGFDSVEDFFKWFSSDFSGKIIHWTDFRY